MNNATEENLIWDNIGDFSLYSFANVLATSITTSCLVFAFKYILPKAKDSINSYNLFRAGKKIKEILTCCKRAENPIEEFLPTELDHNIYQGVLSLSDYLYLMVKSTDNAEQKKSNSGRFTYDFPTTKIIIRNLNGEKLPKHVSEDLLNREYSHRDSEKFLRMQDAILKQVSKQDDLRNYLGGQLSKWFLNGKCKFTVTEDADGYISKNYYLGDYNRVRKGFVPLIVVSVIEKTGDILLSESDYQRGMDVLSDSPITKPYHTNKIQLEESNKFNSI